MRPIVCGINTGSGLNLMRANVTHQNALRGIQKRKMPAIRIVSDRKLEVIGANPLHF